MRWRSLYLAMETGLGGVPGVRLTLRPAHEEYVGSSFQFLLPQRDAGWVMGFVAGCAGRGVELKWFGADQPVAFTSRYDHWAYASPDRLPQTDRVLAGLIDMRLPLTFSVEDVALIGRIIAEEAVANHAPVGAVLGAE